MFLLANFEVWLDINRTVSQVLLYILKYIAYKPIVWQSGNAKVNLNEWMFFEKLSLPRIKLALILYTLRKCHGRFLDIERYYSSSIKLCSHTL